MGLDVVELLLAVEEEFGIEIPDAAAERISSVGGMQNFVIEALRSQGTPFDEGDVWKRLRALIVFQLGVRPEEVKREAEFVRDLRAD